MVLLALGEQAGTDAPWTVRSKILERLWVCADGNPFPCCGPKPSKTKVRPVLPWPKEIQTQPYCANGLTALEGRLRCTQSLARQKNQPPLKTIYRKLSGYCRLLIRAKKPPPKWRGFSYRLCNDYIFCRFSIKLSTTLGSARVDMSPKLE